MRGGPGGGIFDDFPGFRVPSDAQLDDALRSALVVLDTNVLLNLYRYNDSTRDDLLGVAGGLGDRLWVPHQVMREFWRNRLSVIAGRSTAAEQAVAALAEQRNASVETVRRWARSTVVAAAEREGLVESIQKLHAELAGALQAHAPAELDLTRAAMDEPVLRALETLLDGRVGRADEPADWEAAVADGIARIARRQPPGYRDADKAGSTLPEGPTGDYLVWRQAVEEARSRGTDLLIVTADQKADWWWRYGPDLIGPRVELVAEFAAEAGGRLFMMRPADLLRRAAALAVQVRRESVADAEQVAATAAGSVWTAAGVTALFERLDAESPEQAALIRAAAANGGRVERDEVDGLLPPDETALRAFATPVARVTRELQDAGLVAPDVAPALVVEHAGVPVVALRTAAEIATLLAPELV
ncbi:hypothetical protein GCM10009609_41480 [Pseudonocardia aurantiaca]|uniref:PIN-like domain-containing protein n=1 Tax=Pseudonocardia aurantiaca TaxID=75290 RepID=A0ABW4FPD4_9PSEU